MHTYIRTYVRTYIHTCINTYIHTYIHPYIHACMHTYIYLYMHTYIYLYMHACTFTWDVFLVSDLLPGSSVIHIIYTLCSACSEMLFRGRSPVQKRHPDYQRNWDTWLHAMEAAEGQVCREEVDAAYTPCPLLPFRMHP